MKFIALVLAFLLGLALVGYGFALIYRPLGWIFAGAAIICFAALAVHSIRNELSGVRR